jgi:hypothetical protein
LALDGEGEERLAKTSAKETRLLYPPSLWPDPARAFWNAFPPESVLAEPYAQSIPVTEWSKLGSHGILLTRLTWLESVPLDAKRLLELSTDIDPEGEHTPTASETVEVGCLALVGTGDFGDALRKSKRRASRFLRFVLEHVSRTDASWKKRVSVPCSCGKTHTVIPCSWLAWMRRTQWVPRGDLADPISTESLARLTSADPDLAALVTSADAQEFLDALGINVLEQTLLLRSESERADIRQKLARLTRSLAKPSDIDVLVESMLERQKTTQWWAENQELGKRVEVLLKELLQQEKALDLDVHFVGYDLEAHVRGDVLADDVGSLAAGHAKIEIKATRYDSISMSGIQAATAIGDVENFWLGVLPVNADEATASIDLPMLRARMRFVERIGERLQTSRDELDNATTAARAKDIELEHVEEVRFRVKRTVWETDGVSVEDFIKRLVG